MGRDGIAERLRKLEEQAAPGLYARSEEREKEQCLLEMRFERMRLDEENTDAKHARSLIGLFRVQNLLPGMGMDELVDRILSWRPMPVGGRSRATTEREVCLAIHRREPGTEGMVCPTAWRESFIAGEELVERYDSIPDEMLAEYYLRRGEIEEVEDEEELERWASLHEERLGITRDLLDRAVGPDAEIITKQERQRRLDGYLADLIFGEKGYGIARHVERLLKVGLGAPRGEGRS